MHSVKGEEGTRLEHFCVIYRVCSSSLGSYIIITTQIPEPGIKTRWPLPVNFMFKAKSVFPQSPGIPPTHVTCYLSLPFIDLLCPVSVAHIRLPPGVPVTLVIGSVISIVQMWKLRQIRRLQRQTFVVCGWHEWTMHATPRWKLSGSIDMNWNLFTLCGSIWSMVLDRAFLVQGHKRRRHHGSPLVHADSHRPLISTTALHLCCCFCS